MNDTAYGAAPLHRARAAEDARAASRNATTRWLAGALTFALLLGAGAVFINVVRFFVPFRLAAALALAPAVRRTFFESEPPTRDAEDDGRT